MESSRLTLDTSGRLVSDLTGAVRDFARERGGDGLVNVFLPHATCGVALMETGSGSEGDLEEAIDGFLPPDDRYAHRHGLTGHGRDHLLPLFISPSLTLPVEDGEVVLGTWQSVVLVDTNRENNPRNVVLSLLRG